ncbi:MAG: M24 family metallopeptidase [Candidatus Hodarchaeales archaeon]|jgi:Xaa-Pro aminopeptidase
MSEGITPIDVKQSIVKEKHTKLPEIMRKNDIDCWLIFVRETAVTPDSTMNFVVGGDVVLQSAFIFALKNDTFHRIAIIGNFDAATEQEKGIWTEVIGYVKGIKEPLRDKINDLNPKKIALNYSLDDYSSDGLTHGMFQVLSTLLPEYTDRFVSAQNIVDIIRGCKSNTEVELIKRACELTEEINKVVTKTLEVGQSETEVQAKFHSEIAERKLGFSWQREQNPMIDVVKEKEFGHILPQPTNFIQKGHTMHNDFGIRFHGYGSDLQRMWFFGSKEELPKELRNAMDTVIEAIQLAAAEIKPGVQGYKIDELIRDFITSRGYEEYKHALGHQVGLMAHDGGCLLGPLWPRYGNSPKQLIQTGQVFALEPSLKTKNHGMVAMEENIVVTEDGCEFLVKPKKDFIYVNG